MEFNLELINALPKKYYNNPKHVGSMFIEAILLCNKRDQLTKVSFLYKPLGFWSESLPTII